MKDQQKASFNGVINFVYVEGSLRPAQVPGLADGLQFVK